MSTSEIIQKSGTNKNKSQNWLATLASTFRARWAEMMADFPQPRPQLNHWLALLQAAEAEPQQIPAYLSQLLNQPQSSRDCQQSWTTLTKLFGLTFEAAQATTPADDPVWPHLIDLQNRILTTAATITLVRPNRPSTDILTRRALYLQTVTTLNQKIFSTRETNKLLDEVVALIQQNFGYDYINLFLLNQTKRTLTLQSALWHNHRPMIQDMPPFSLDDQRPTARAATTNQIIWIDDMTQSVAPPLLPDIQAQISIPLSVENNLLGVLDIASEQAHAFSVDDRQILRALADHIAVAIENLRLQSALYRHTQEQKFLYESNMALGTTLDRAAVLKFISKKIVEAVEVGACVICQIDQKASQIITLAEYILPAPDAPTQLWRKLNVPIPLADDPIARQILKAKRPIIGRATTNPVTNWQKPSAEEASWGTVLALPFDLNKQTAGLIEIYDKNPQRAFSPGEVELCQTLATQATLALERAQIFQKTQQRLNQVSALYTMSQKITDSLDLQPLMDAIVMTLRQAIDCRGCCIFLLDQDKTVLEIKAADGLKPKWKDAAKLRVGEGVAGLSVARGETIYLPNTYNVPDFIFFDEAVRSLLVTPLTAHGEIIGTISVDDDRPNAFGPEQEQLLKIAAAQVGIAIENARLFAKISTERQQNQAIIQYMADGLLVIDSQQTIVTCNPALAMMLNLPRHQIIGQKVGSPNLHPNLASITATTTQRARTGVLVREVTLTTPAPKTLQVFATTMIDDNKKPAGEVRVVHDVTKERQLEQLKDDFMSTISHELRTPLFSIQGFAQILLEDEASVDPKTRREFLTTIHTQAVQLSDMVNNLLDLGKFDEGKLELERDEVSILKLLYQVSSKLQGFARQQKVELLSELPASLPLIMGDTNRLGQVVTNLIGNAIKFTKVGGQVRLTASVLAQEVLIEVQDTGIGIPEEELQKVFDRYYQVNDQQKESLRGTGLGLHIAKKIVEGHGGRIWAESSVSQGSTFRFTLPLSNANS